MALLNFGFPGSYTTVAGLRVDVKGRTLDVLVSTYESAAKRTCLSAVPHTFRAVAVQDIAGKVDEAPTELGFYLLKMAENDYHVVQVVQGPIGPLVEAPRANVSEILRTPDGKLYRRANGYSWEEITAGEVVTNEQFDEFFSIAAMNEGGTNVVAKAYLFLKSRLLYSQATDA